MTSETFAGRLALAMTRKSLKQTGLAKKIGALQGVVQRWLTTDKLPEGKYMVKLPGVLGVSGHWLLTGVLPIEPPGEEPDLQATYTAGWFLAQDAARRAVVALKPPPTLDEAAWASARALALGKLAEPPRAPPSPPTEERASEG